MGGMGIFELPAMIEPDGSMGNLTVAIAGILLTMVIAFVITMISFKDKAKNTNDSAIEIQKNEITTDMEKPLVKKTMLIAPVDGKVIALCDVQDDAFASEILGKGCAILPTDGCFHAPCLLYTSRCV